MGNVVVPGAGAVPVYVEVEKKTEVSNAELGDLVKDRISMLDQERLTYQRAASGLKCCRPPSVA